MKEVNVNSREKIKRTAQKQCKKAEKGILWFNIQHKGKWIFNKSVVLLILVKKFLQGFFLKSRVLSRPSRPNAA